MKYLLVLMLVGCSTAPELVAPPPLVKVTYRALVSSVVDGDAVDVEVYEGVTRAEAVERYVADHPEHRGDWIIVVVQEGRVY